MDLDRLDAMARSLAEASSRRKLLGVLATLPVGVGLLDLLNTDEAEAKDRRRRRKDRHKRRKNPGNRKRKGKGKGKGCKPKSQATVCAGQCGPIESRDTCGKTVDCGPCACDPACAACQSCDATTQTCVDLCPAASCCDAARVNLQTDAAHCGACGNVCPGDQTCQGGVCGVACGSDFCPAATEICVDDVCEVCAVTCAGSATECGAALHAALSDASLATVHVCPGAYRGGFTISRSVTVIGASEGDDPVTGTVLDGGGTQPVLDISAGSVALRQLHITGGNAGFSGGGGISCYGDSLTMHDCTVAGNQGRVGGGISHSGGSLTMTRCTVRDNEAPEDIASPAGGGLSLSLLATLTDCLIENNVTVGIGGGCYAGPLANVTLAGATIIRGNTASQGGGIFSSLGPVNTITIGEDCRITGNTADAGEGGGIARSGTGQIILEGTDDPSPIVTDNCHENCTGDVPKCAVTPISC